MKIRFYGRLAETIAPEVDLDAAPFTCVGELRQRLAADYPAAEATLANRRSAACLGGTVVRDDHPVDPFDEIEFLPPVSGG